MRDWLSATEPEFRRWFTYNDEWYVREVLSSIPEFNAWQLGSFIAWPETNCVTVDECLRAWKRELEHRIDGYVYLLEAGSYFKIGRAKKPFERARTLAIQLPYESRLVHVIACEDYIAGEKAFHDAYADMRLNGEWFELTPEEIEYICLWDRYNVDPYEDSGPISRREQKNIGRAVVSARGKSTQ